MTQRVIDSVTGPQDPAFESWLEGQLQHSARAMLASISPVAIVKQRPGFGQTVRPVAGAIVASPVLGDWDPEPDYFFHWFRDSALVIDALRLLHLERRVGSEALQHLRDFTRFSLALNQLDGRLDAAVPDRRARVAPDFLQFLREDHDLARTQGDAVVMETRVNPDGTLDISRWTRPQHDGPPLRALALLRWVAGGQLDPPLLAQVSELIRFDLGFTLRHWREPSYDIWEEELGHHYYTLRVSAAALAEGAAWLQGLGDAPHAQRCREESQAVLRLLDGYRVDAGEGAAGYYRSRVLVDGRPSAKELDIAVILSAIHAADAGLALPPLPPRRERAGVRVGAARETLTPTLSHKWEREKEPNDESVSPPLPPGREREPDAPSALPPLPPRRERAGVRVGADRESLTPTLSHAWERGQAHTVADPCMQATLAQLDALFDTAYPINHRRPAGRGPAMGRYAGDVYFSGGAYYFATLGAAQFCFDVATLGGDDAGRWFARGDAYLATVRAYTPASGDLSEQFDQTSGAQNSARHLAWSYAAFISCVFARRRAAAALRTRA